MPLASHLRRLAWCAGAALVLFRAPTGTAAEALPSAITQPAPPGGPTPSLAPISTKAIPKGVEIDPAGLLLFTVDLNGTTLTEGLSAYGDVNDPLVPIGELTRLLELDVDVNPAKGQIVGRLGPTKRSIAIDVASSAGRNGQKLISLTPEDFAVTDNEIYLRVSAAKQILPLNFKVDGENLALGLEATEELPVQARLERMARSRTIGQGGGLDEFLSVRSPYRFYTLPAYDITLGTGYNTAPGNHFPLRYDIRVGSDFLYSGFSGYLSSDDRGVPTSARMLLQRRSVAGKLFGPLQATDASAGDVYTPALQIGPRSIGGRGIYISNVPLDQTSVFNRIDLRGELPIGYDVELYINDVLRSAQNTPSQGRYEFLNVPLSRGVNVVRIVTYGPRGERSEQTRVVNVGGGQLERGAFTYEFGVVQQETPVVQVRRTTFDLISPGQGQLRAVASVNYGLTQFVTVAAGAAILPAGVGSGRQIYTAGARSSLYGVLTQFNVAADNTGGVGATLGLAAQLWGVSGVLQHAEFRKDFLDENGGEADVSHPTRRRTEGTLDSAFKFAGQLVPVTLRLRRTLYADGAQEWSASQRGSISVKDILVSGGLEYSYLTSTLGNGTEVLSGFIAASTTYDFKWQLRASLDYDILPDFKARTIAISVDRQLSRNTSLRVGVGQSLDDLKSFNVNASAIFRTRYGDLAITSDYGNQTKDFTLGVQLSYGLLYNREAGRYQVTPPGPGTGGSMMFHAFVDRNGDGVYERGEEPLPDVGVDVGGQVLRTNAKGMRLVTGLGSSPNARLSVDLEKVDNPYLRAPPGSLQLEPRPGSYTVVSYPMQPTGEVLVRIQLRRADGRLVGLSATNIRVTAADGRVFESTTEFDGVTIIENLPVGSYTLALDPAQSQRLHMRLLNLAKFTVKGDGSHVPDITAEVIFDRPAEDRRTADIPNPASP